MKKIINGFLCFCFLISNQMFVCAQIFEDELIEKLDKNLKVEKYQPKYIVDDFVNSSLDKNLKISTSKNIELEDDFAKRTLDSNLKIEKYKQTFFEDNLANQIDKNSVAKIENKKPTLINISNDKIKISPKRNYTTRKAQLRDKIEFILMEDIKIDNVFYKKNQLVTASVENFTQNGAYGVPADIVVGNFKIGNQPLEGTITKQGANRAIWVYPTAYILAPFFGLGLFILPIRGGHAKLKTNKIYEIDI